jgi:hypothetical protein
MIVKGTKQLGSFRKGINLYVPKREASKTNELYSNGLYGKRYSGYFGDIEGSNDNVNWFDTATLHGDVNQLTEINNFTSSDDYYSWQWFGYFKASSTENYTFYTSSDDASYVWIGDNAVNGYTRANANVNNGGTHGPQPAESSPVSLVAGTYYPIRVQFGENGGGDEMSLSFSTPTIAQTTNGLGYYYYDPNVALAGSLLFDNQNQFLQLPRSEVISILDPEPFTIEAWIKPTSIRTIASPGLDGDGNPIGNYGDIIIGDTEGGGNNWSLQLFNNKLTFYRYNEGARFFTSNTQIPLNEWTHVAVAYDGGSTLWIFINGTLDVTFGDYSRPSIQYSVITIGNLFNTGSTVWDNGAYAYKGYITNLRINDNQTFYQMVSPFEPTAPLKHIFGTTLLLLANTNQPIKDSSPSNITITNVGSVTSSSQYPTVADCANNDAKVLMVGWPGPRPLTRVNENLYIYYVGNTPGDETLDRANSSSPWVYKNAGNEIVRSLTVSQFPWQASWPSTHTATKICPQAPDIDNMFFPSLWLDASTGVSKLDFNYISEIVISGTSNPSFSGTYTADNIPDLNFNNNYPNDYNFTGPNDKTISFNNEFNEFRINSVGESEYSFTSSDGINWALYGNSNVMEILVNGFTGEYSTANGLYTRDNIEGDFYRIGGGFIIHSVGDGNSELRDDTYDVTIATNDSNFEGAWTATSFINQVTVSEAGRTSVNGVYTRSQAGIGDKGGFTGPVEFIFQGGYDGWSLGGGMYWYLSDNLEDWRLGGGNYGEGDVAPIGVTATALRPIGSPTSTASAKPSGSISGSVTTSTVNTDLVTSWDDQSNNGNNANSSEGTQPTFVSNVLNSKPILRFDGAGQKMNLTSSIGGTTYTIFIVCKNNDNSYGSMFFWSTDENYGKYIGVITDQNYNASARNKFVLSEADAGSGGEGSVIAWSSRFANNNFFIGTAMQNGGGKAYLNGFGGTNSLGTFVASNTFDLIGGYIADYELDGDIAEIISYNRALTIPERQEVETYLINKYAIDTSITTSIAFNSSGEQVGSTNTGDIPDNWVEFQSVASVIFADNDSVTTIGSSAFVNNVLTTVTIPNSVNSIGSSAFRYNAINSLSLGTGVTSIDSYAFANNQLTAVTIPNNVTSIGSQAFYGNPVASVNINTTNVPDIFYSFNTVSSLTLGPNVITIGDNAFTFNAINALTIPNNVTSIGSDAFRYNAIATLSLGTGVNSIGNGAFSNNGLIIVTIPNNVTSIGNNAFANNPLTSINVDLGNPNYSSDEAGVLFDKLKTILIQYPSGRAASSYTIPNSVTSIGGGGFNSCSGLTSVTIPNSVTSIGIYAFQNCSSLAQFILSSGRTQIPNSFANGSAIGGELVIPNSVTSIGSNAFSYNAFTSITIPNSVTSIGNGAFSQCNGLSTITIPNSVTSIGTSAFASCYSLTTVTLPTNVNFTSIADSMFNGCSILETITIPNNVTSIGSDVFKSCSSITSITIPNSVTSIGSYTFGYTGLTSITIPNSVTSIGNYMFAFSISLATVTLPTNINFTSIGALTFFKCFGLTSITIPNSVTSIGSAAFGYTGLTSINIPNSVTSIGNGAFYYCTSLASVTIPNSVTSIEQGAFAQCTSLSTVTIPNSVTSIGNGAFADCTSLTTVLCYVAQSAFTANNAFARTSSPLTIRVRSTDTSWTVGTRLSFQGNDNVTVIKNL